MTTVLTMISGVVIWVLISAFLSVILGKLEPVTLLPWAIRYRCTLCGVGTLPARPSDRAPRCCETCGNEWFVGPQPGRLIRRFGRKPEWDWRAPQLPPTSPPEA